MDLGTYMQNIINVNGLCHEILRKNKCSATRIIYCGLSNQILYFMFCLTKVFSDKCDVLSNQIFISIKMDETWAPSNQVILLIKMGLVIYIGDLLLKMKYCSCTFMSILMVYLRVHINENIFGSDFEFCTISLSRFCKIFFLSDHYRGRYDFST